MKRFSSMRSLGARCIGALWLCAFSLTAACDSPKEKEAEYLSQAKELYEKGDIVKAALQFKNALQINPAGAEAQYYLGLIAEKQGDVQAAARAFERASAQDPDHVEANRKAGQYSLLAGDIESAKRHATRLIELEPKESGGHGLLAAALLASGKVEEAQKEVTAALALAPNNTDALVIAAGIQARQGKLDEALAIIEKGLATKPDSVDLLLVKLKVLFDRKSSEDVIAVLRRLHQIDPANPSYAIDLSNQLASAGQLDEAEGIFKAAVSSDKASDALIGAYATFLVQRRSIDDAIKEIKALTDKTHAPKYVLLLSQLYLTAGKLPEANALMVDLQKNAADADDRLRASVELARIAALKGDLKGALDQLNAVLEQDNTNDFALLLRAGLMLNEKRYDEAIGDARSVLRRNINSVSGLSLLADTYAARGERNLAIDALRDIVRIQPGNVDARLKLASLLSSTSPDEAIQHIDAAIALRPDAVELSLQKADFLLRTGAMDKAEVIGNSLLENPKYVGSAHRILGQVALARSDYALAISELLEAKKAGQPFDVVAPALAEAYVRSGKASDADALLKEQIKQQPDDIKSMMLLARLRVQSGQAKDGEDLLRQAVSAQPEQTAPYVALMGFLASQGSYDKGLELADIAAAKFPDDHQIATLAAVAADSANSLDLAKSRYEQIVDKWPEDVVAANNLAALIADNWPNDQALLDRARKLAEKFRNSTNPLLLDTLGWVLVRQGNFDDGTVILERAVSGLPTNQQIQFHYAAALNAKGLKSKAREVFEKALADNPTYRGIDEARKLASGLD